MSQRINRIRYCVLICESLYNDYDNTSPFVQLGNFAAIQYSLSWLIDNDIEEVFLFYSHSKQPVQQFYQSVNKNSDIKLHLHYMKPTELKSFGDIIREVHFRDLLSEDFLILYADNLSNINLREMANNHLSKKAELKNMVLSIGTRKGISQNIYILNSQSNQILQLETECNKEFSLNTQKINLKKVNVDFRRDLVAIDVCICTIEVVKSFNQNYQYQTMQDFIIGMLTSQVYQQKINVYQIRHNEVSYRLNRASNFYLAYMNFICGYLNPYNIYNDDRLNRLQRNQGDRLYTVQKYNKIFRRNVKVAESTSLSNNVYIGQSTKIEANCNIIKSIIGKNCIINKNVSLKNCIVLDGCTLNQNASFEYCLIEKVNETTKIHNFKNDLLEEYERLIDRELFQQTPPSEEATFEQELQEQLMRQKSEDETIIVSELVRIRRQFQKSQREFTKQFIRTIKPQGVKGIENLTNKWGSILNKIHHEESQDLISSLFYACSNLQDYLKAFHLILQYFYHFDVLTKQSILEWYHSSTNDTVTFVLCKAFIQKLQEESSQEQDEQEEGEQNEQ